MRIIKKSLQNTTDNFEQISRFEEEHNFRSDVDTGLNSLFLLSHNLPCREISEFFSGNFFPLAESFEEAEASYQLIKYGFYKQSMISLRLTLEMGLLSIYWSIIGKNSTEFKRWYASKFDTPYKNKEFFKKLLSSKNIFEFDNNFGIIQEIKSLNFLSDFVHKKGFWFSNYSKFQEEIRGNDKFELFKKWLLSFKQIVKILEILHLLQFPSMTLRYSTDFLLLKFGTFSKIPQFGCGFGDEMEDVFSFIPIDQKQFINEQAKSDQEVKHIIDWLNNMPDLSKAETNDLIVEEQKENINSMGFLGWEKTAELYDIRINQEIKDKLQCWASSNNFMENRLPKFIENNGSSGRK